jgi:hypothetical protein
VRHGPSRCLGAKEAWASSDCSVLIVCVSDGVGLDQPPLSETFWNLLGDEGGRLQGLMHGPRSPRAPEGSGKLCLLMPHPRRDPIEGAVGRGTPRERCQGAPEHRWPGACLLVHRPWLASIVRQEPMAGPGGAVDQEPKAWESPRALDGSCG